MKSTVTNNSNTIGQILYQLNTWKGVVRLATTTNISLVGIQTIDNVTPVINDIVLVKNQTNSVLNGLYQVRTSNWLRTENMALKSNASGSAIFVKEGTSNADKLFVCTNFLNDVVGVNGLIFETLTSSIASGNNNSIQINSDGHLTAYDSFTFDGNTLFTPSMILSGNLLMQNGNIQSKSLKTNNILVEQGDLSIPEGTVFSKSLDTTTLSVSENVNIGTTLIANSITSENNIFANQGNIEALNGSIVAKTGVVVDQGDITTVSGNIESITGSITSGSGIVSIFGDIVSNSGDIASDIGIIRSGKGCNIGFLDSSSIELGSINSTLSLGSDSSNIGFFGNSPVSKPTNDIKPAFLLSATGETITENSTFNGYTIGQIVSALQSLGLLN